MGVLFSKFLGKSIPLKIPWESGRLKTCPKIRIVKPIVSGPFFEVMLKPSPIAHCVSLVQLLNIFYPILFETKFYVMQLLFVVL